MKKQEKSVYDKKFYRKHKEYRINKLLRQKALTKLSQRFPKEFERILEKLKKQQEKK